MKKSKHTDEQIVRALREVDATSVGEVAKKMGVTENTIYVWKRKFRGQSVDDVKTLKALAAENAKLKKLLAEQLLTIEVLKEVNGKKW